MKLDSCPNRITLVDKLGFELLTSAMKFALIFCFNVMSFLTSAFGAIHLDPNEVRPWNKKEKDEFPSPLAAIFKKDGKVFAFVGDRHADPKATYKLVELAIARIKPEIIVIESLEHASGKDPKKHLNRYIGKTREAVWKDPSLGCGTELIAIAQNIPIIGGEPTIEEQMKSPFLVSKAYTPEDILNVQILQRIPYRRDKMSVSDFDTFLGYALNLYRVKESQEKFKAKFLMWYKAKTQKDFNYQTITKEDSAVNCALDDSFLQKVACEYNINRDRYLVEKIDTLLKEYNSVLVVYGTGHFVQQYPSFIKGFGFKPEYIK